MRLERRNGELISLSRCARRVATLRPVFPILCSVMFSSITPTEGARELIDATHAAGGHFGVVSGGFERKRWSLPSRLLGIDFYASRLETGNGVLTSRDAGAYRDLPGQGQLREWALVPGIAMARTVAIGDGAGIPMMDEAGVGIAFARNPAVRERVSIHLTCRSRSSAGTLNALGRWFAGVGQL